MVIMNSKKSGDASDKDYIELDSNDDIDKKNPLNTYIDKTRRYVEELKKNPVILRNVQLTLKIKFTY